MKGINYCASAKYTVARELGAALRLPVLSLDPVKEALAEPGGTPSTAT